MRDDHADELASAVAGATSPGERLALAASVLQGALARSGIELVVVGGAALATWDPTAPATPDIDLVGLATRAELDTIFGALGFVRETGRHWWREDLELAIEVPDDELEPPEARVAEIALGGGRVVRVIAIEDLLCDRLDGWAATGDLQLYQQAARLDAHPQTDHDRLAQRVDALGLSAYLVAVRVLRTRDLEGQEVSAADSQVARAAARGGATAGDVAAALGSD